MTPKKYLKLRDEYLKEVGLFYLVGYDEGVQNAKQKLINTIETYLSELILWCQAPHSTKWKEEYGSTLALAAKMSTANQEYVKTVEMNLESYSLTGITTFS